VPVTAQQMSPMMAPTPTAPGYPSYPAGYVSPQQLVAAQQLLHVSVDSFSTARFVSAATGGFDTSSALILAGLIRCQRCYWWV